MGTPGISGMPLIFGVSVELRNLIKRKTTNTPTAMSNCDDIVTDFGRICRLNDPTIEETKGIIYFYLSLRFAPTDRDSVQERATGTS